MTGQAARRAAAARPAGRSPSTACCSWRRRARPRAVDPRRIALDPGRQRLAAEQPVRPGPASQACELPSSRQGRALGERAPRASNLSLPRPLARAVEAEHRLARGADLQLQQALVDVADLLDVQGAEGQAPAFPADLHVLDGAQHRAARSGRPPRRRRRAEIVRSAADGLPATGSGRDRTGRRRRRAAAGPRGPRPHAPRGSRRAAGARRRCGAPGSARRRGWPARSSCSTS